MTENAGLTLKQQEKRAIPRIIQTAVSYTHLDVYKRQEQGQAVTGIMENAGFEQVTVKKDLAGLDRVCLLYTSRCV